MTQDQANRLTPNQTAVLMALADGFTAAEIAVDWGVSGTVVYRSIEGARSKLGARTNAEAVAIWVKRQVKAAT